MNKVFIPVLFLTPDGHKSTKEVPRNRYEPISFREHIIPWLEACLEFEKKKKALPVEDKKNILPVREVNLTQYINAIKSFCGIMEDEAMEKEIQELIMSSDDKYKAALQIGNVIKKLDGKILEIFKDQIFKPVKRAFPDPGTRYVRENTTDWYEIVLRNGLMLSVSLDLKLLVVQKTKMSLSAERKDKIISYMKKITNDSNKATTKHELDIWSSRNTRCYPALKDYDGDMYMYKLYQIYLSSEARQKVAVWIVSIAKKLEKI